MAEVPAFRELYERALDGDRDALAEIYLQYNNQLCRRIAYKLKELRIAWAVDPDDVFHSFFVRILEGRVRGRFNSAAHFVNYCEAAVRNACQQVLRSVILRDAWNISECPPDLFADQRAADHLDQLTWNERLEEGYLQLTPLERVVCFYRLGEHTWEEIGRRIGKSPAAVRMIHLRACQRLEGDLLVQE